ncbi:unnamed protein product [Dicrocoelium dendriticum]|nr:unnamed protein product [Dicrocoelium dendriticum]
MKIITQHVQQSDARQLGEGVRWSVKFVTRMGFIYYNCSDSAVAKLALKGPRIAEKDRDFYSAANRSNIRQERVILGVGLVMWKKLLADRPSTLIIGERRA